MFLRPVKITSLYLHATASVLSNQNHSKVDRSLNQEQNAVNLDEAQQADAEQRHLTKSLRGARTNYYPLHWSLRKVICLCQLADPKTLAYLAPYPNYPQASLSNL